MSEASTQIHVLIGCSDARDVGQVHLETVEKVRSEYLARGIRSELFILRTPGSFVTADVIADLSHIVGITQRDLGGKGDIAYFAHIVSHGSLVISGEETYGCGLHNLEVEAGSPFNCGMLGATTVAVSLERLLIEVAPTIALAGGRTLKLDSEDAVRDLLRLHYGFNGYLAGDWIRSVDDLRTHVRLQRAVLEREIRNNPDLRSLELHVTAGIQDYGHNAYVRVDGGVPDGKFWDEGQRLINKILSALPADAVDRARQSALQKPLVGLFAMADIRMSRARALKKFAELTNLSVAGYEPNTVFAISGSAFDLPTSPFGPYAIGGLYYSIIGLELKKYLVMGNDMAQAERMVRKIQRDPIANVIVKHFGVELVPVVA